MTPKEETPLASRTQRSLQAVAVACALVAQNAFAFDGSETLGPPSGLTIAAGSEVLVAGTGMKDKFEGTINLNVPTGVTVKQVIAYWEGQALAADEQGITDDVLLNGLPVTGSRIGGPTNFFFSRWSSTYRADVTAMGLITNGDNVVKVRGLNFKGISNGLGLAVIIDDGQNTGTISIRDGNDNAFRDFANPLDVTETQTYTFPAASTERTASLAYFFGSVAPARPTTIEVSINGSLAPSESEYDVLGDTDGPEWDSYMHTVTIPAGVTSLSVRVVSADSGLGPYTGNLPASLTWVFHSLSLPNPKSMECGPDLWKKHITLWDGCGRDDVTCNIKTYTNWMRVFGVSSCRSKLRRNATVLDAICLTGDSDIERLNRHAAAALLAADSNLEYAYTLRQVIHIYRDAVGAICGPETVKTALAKFEAANELYCKLPTPRTCKPRCGDRDRDDDRHCDSRRDRDCDSRKDRDDDCRRSSSRHSSRRCD